MPANRGVSKFAQSVSDTVKIPYRTGSSIKSEQPSTAAAAQPTPKAKVSNGAPKRPSFAIEIQVPNGIHAATQLTKTTSSAEKVASKKRKRVTEDKRLDYHDQKQSAKEALLALENYAEQVLDAADTYQGSQSTSEVAEHFQQNSLVDDSDVPVMSEHSLSSLDSLVRKAVAEKAFHRADLSQLVRTQKLLEGTCSAVNRLTLSIGGDAGESEREEWELSLVVASCATQAIKVLLRTMTAKRDEKELYSEDLVETMLLSLENIVENCIVPVIESRTAGENSAFSIYLTCKSLLLSILKTTGRAVRLLGEFVANVDFAESSLAKVEYLARKLIFIENAPSEKEAVLGIQNFEALRRSAMDTLAQIFARHPNQRTSLLDEVLMSLEKLPSNRQSARQFKLEDRKPIQLVSALLMRLVQSSALWTDTKVVKSRNGHVKNESDDDSEDESQLAVRGVDPIDIDTADNYNLEDAANELRKVSRAYDASSNEVALHIIRVLITRALSSTKSGDQPYRNLLDIFTEDFLNVLGLPDWPAGEMLLQAMLHFFLSFLKDDKRAVPQKNMALDLITIVGTHIAEIKQQAKNLDRSLEASLSPHADALRALIRFHEADNLATYDIVSQDGPYRMVFQYLYNKRGDPQIDSARALHLIQWANTMLDIAILEKESNVTPQSLLQLRNAIVNPTWFSKDDDFFIVDRDIAHAATSIITIASKVCKAQAAILSHLISAIDSPHSQLKSKALKNVPQLLEKDPTLLKGPLAQVLMNQIHQCSRNSSPLVRSSALTLLETCMMLNPRLESETYTRITELAEDDNASVRKRATKTLKDIYLRNRNKVVRANISAAIIKCSLDHEDEVAKLAKQTFEELWFVPLHDTSTGQDPTLRKIALDDQVMLMLKTAQGPGVRGQLADLLRSSFSSESRFANLNLNVAKELVHVMFDKLIDGARDQNLLASTLPIFAKVRPRLFSSQHLRLLEPYIRNLESSDQLALFSAAIIIFRHVVPSLSSLEKDFLVSIRQALIKATPIIPWPQLPETAACVWAIRNALNDSRQISNLVRSVLEKISEKNSEPTLQWLYRTLKDVKAEQKSRDVVQEEIGRLVRYVRIAGSYIQICELDDDAQHFAKKFPKWTGKSVAALAVDQLIPLTQPYVPQTLRECALNSIGMICQTWPRNYLRNDVAQSFENVFVADEIPLQTVVLNGFLEFFLQEERRSESGAEIKVGHGAVHGQERLAKSFVASDNDGAVTTIAQKFLKHVLQTALATTGDLALMATRVVVSINRQGLVHPKECGPALIALETSTNPQIAEISFKAHQIVHSKHETMFEKEYMKAVRQAYTYQRDIIKDPRGITLDPHVPKLKPLFGVLKTGTSKVRQRFLTNLTAHINFELAKLDIKGDMPNHVVFARFVLENLAFFEYSRIVELVTLISALEKMVVTGTGAGVAHAIETEILNLKLESSVNPGDIQMETPLPSVEHDNEHPKIDAHRLHQLAAASMILSMVWEVRTHLRAVWGLQKSKGKISAKDLNKAPVRQASVSGDKLVERMGAIMGSLRDPDTRMAQIRAFAELIAIDPELKVAADEDDEFCDLAQKAAVGGFETPSADEGEGGAAGGTKSGSTKKRKAGAGSGSAVKKQRRSATPSKKSRGRSKKAKPGSDASDDDNDGAWN